jgi:hypothetical protein
MAYQSTEAAVVNLNSSGSGVSDTNRGCILQIFNLISTGTTITATMCLPCLLIYMVISVPSDEPLSISTLIHMILQAYEMIMLSVIIVIEMEWSVAIRNISIMQSWGSRGLCYIFVGLLVFQELGGMAALPCTDRYPFLKVPCIALLGLGAIYSIMVSRCVTHQLQASRGL